MEPNLLNTMVGLIKPENFMPHGQCLLWEPGLLGLHVLSDISIVIAYYSIPLALVQLVRKREDLKFGWIFMLFGCFIFLCGTTHLVSILTVWQPHYWLEGWLKLITALVSMATAFALWPLIPKALALPSTNELKRVNEELELEIQERKRAEEELEEARHSLEKMVEERTAKLQQINQTLKNEIIVREETEIKLKDSQKILETIFESTLDAIVVTDEKGNFIRWNQQAEAIFGWSQKQMIGEKLADTIIPERYREAHLAGIQRFLDTGEAKILNTRIEIEALNEKREEFPVELSIAFSDLKQKTFIAFLRDITARKTVEQELIQAKEEAEYSNRAKSEFLARMSHELRTPMNAILGFGQLLKMDLDHPLEKHQQDNVQRILKAGNHLLNLINEILDLSKVESGEMEFSMENVCVQALLNEVQSLVFHLAQDIQVKIENNIQDDLYVIADYIRLKQVLLNLLTNAIKYNKIGGQVEINSKKKDEVIEISIKDTGNGVPDDKKDQIFQPFTRIDANLETIEGTGIGLTITKRLVEHMNGTIQFESEYQKGSTFTVTFPEGEKTSPAPVPEENGSSEAVREVSNGKIKILYVEDNPDNLDLVTQIMDKRSDVDLISASNAEDGIELARAQVPSLIIMDIHLPGMDGLTAYQRLKNYRETVGIPVIALSADAMQADKNRALALGFNHYLTKPINIPEFMDIINKFVK